MAGWTVAVLLVAVVIKLFKKKSCVLEPLVFAGGFVIRTNEELMIANMVCRILGFTIEKEKEQ